MRFSALIITGLITCTASAFACECEGKRGDGEGRPQIDRAALLERFDSDGDGKLSDSEKETAKAQFMAKKGEHREERGEKMKEAHPELFARIDTNGDGTIDQAEREAAKAQMLAKHPKADANGDGKLDRCEIAKAREHVKGERGERGAPEAGGEHGDNGRRAHGNPADNGHDHGRRGKEGL